MGASSSCMQVVPEQIVPEVIGRLQPTGVWIRRGCRIRRRVQPVCRFLQTLRLNVVRKLWPHAAALNRRRSQRAHDNPPYSQELLQPSKESQLEIAASQAATLISDALDPSCIIPGLPRDLALQCLARLPRVLHGCLRLVSKAWQEAVEGKEFVDTRKQLGVSEDWIYLHVGAAPRLDEVQGGCRGGCRGGWELVGGFSSWHALDAERCRWHALPPIPYDQHVTGGHVVLGASCVVFDSELYVLGGAPFGRPALRDCWIYNPQKNRWRKGRPMLTPRFGCLVGVIDRNMYVIGGSEVCYVSTSYSIPGLEIFDSGLALWRAGPSAREQVTQHPCNPLRHVAVVEGKLLVSGPQRVRGRINAGMYDPALNLWTDISPGLGSGWGKPSAILDGRLYTLGFHGYQEYCPARDLWAPVPGKDGDGILEWDQRLVTAMAAGTSKLYMVGTMGPALIIVVAPVKNRVVHEPLRWHTMRLPSGVEFIGDLSFCSCQIISI